MQAAAEKLGISYSFLSALELNHKDLKPKHRKKMAQVYGVQESALSQDRTENEQEFVHWLRNQVGTWDSRFFLPMVRPRIYEVNELFVDVIFKDKEFKHVEEPNMYEILKSFFAERSYPLMIFGDQGSGKSFLLRYIAIELIDKDKEFYNKCNIVNLLVPILVSLGEYEVRGNEPFAHTLAAHYKRIGYDASEGELQRFFQRILDTGRAVLLMDGLDEVTPTAKRDAMLPTLERYFNTELRKAGNKMIVSSRPLDNVLPSEALRTLHLDLWTLNQMHHASLQWYQHDKDTEAQAAAFGLKLQAHDEFFQLGARPLNFHLLTALYSAYDDSVLRARARLRATICGALENWPRARQPFRTRTPLPDARMPPWIEDIDWRRFFIKLVRPSVEDEDNVYKTSFSAGELQRCWEEFVHEMWGGQVPEGGYPAFKDVATRTGSILHQPDKAQAPRRPEELPGFPSLEPEFAFLDDLFAQFYYAKALLDQDPASIHRFVEKNLRHQKWQDVISLAIQDCAGHEFSSMRTLGEQLTTIVLHSDGPEDVSPSVEKPSFAPFIAMRCISDANIYHRWARAVIQKCVTIFLQSYYERDVAEAFKLFGEYGVWDQLRNPIREKYAEVRAEKKHNHETWRVLAAMAKIAEEHATVVKELVEIMAALARKAQKGRFDLPDRLIARRTAWSFRQIGRLRLAGVHIEEALRGLVDALVERVRRGLPNPHTGDPYWHILAVIIQAQNHLRYYGELQNTLDKVCRVVCEAFKAPEAFTPDILLLQFLKTATFHSHLLQEELREALRKLVDNARQRAQGPVRLELKVILHQLDWRSQQVGQRSLDQKAWFRHVYILGDAHSDEVETEQVVKERITEWVNLVTEQAARGLEDNFDFLPLAIAVAGLRHFATALQEPGQDGLPDSYAEVITAIEQILAHEKAKDDTTREERRVFTDPFSDYTFPMYDHVWNCLIELQRGVKIVAPEEALREGSTP
jgi:hypothetical protein